MKNMKRLSSIMVVILLILALYSGMANADVLRVDTNDSGCSDTTGEPYCTIQAAIDDATSGCETILVYEGTYTENIDFSGKAITVLSISGPEKTIIDGDSTNCTGSDCSVVTFNTSEDEDSILSGFTLTDGKGQSSLWGGGIYAYYASPTIINCVITDNSTADGGGVYLQHSSAVFKDCAISSNTATGRTGGVISYSSPSSSPAKFINCNIIDNDARDGAGVQTLYSDYSEFIGCNISGNTATQIGGGIACGGLNTFTRCTISGNTAGGSGGGLYVRNGGSPDFTNCNITGNVTTTGVGGGILFLSSSTSTITNCTISDNTATYPIYGKGGGIYNNSTSNSVTILNSIVYGNTATTGNDLYEGSGASYTVTYSDIGGGYTGTGNINSDPLFNIDENTPVAGKDDYYIITDSDRSGHSGEDSPCIDAGTATGAPGDDIVGISRPQGSADDMGAYENDDS